jgi:hypothetical protein
MTTPADAFANRSVTCLSIGVTALGTTSWIAPYDLTFIGARSGTNATVNCTISLVSAVTAATKIVTPAFTVLWCLGASSSGAANCKIPILAGEVIYFAFSAEGWVICFFEPIRQV